LTSRTTERFREALGYLPANVRRRARDAYRVFRENPAHPSLRFKRVHPTLPIYSARIGLGYRALATVDDNVAVWFWIGTHAEYDKLLRQM
jgi:hypothetical protein